MSPAHLDRVCVAVVARDAVGGLGRSVARGFEALGCEVVAIPYPPVQPRLATLGFRGGAALDGAAVGAIRPLSEALVLNALRRAKPALTLFLKCDDLHAQTYTLARRFGAGVIAAFHPDDPFNSGRRGLRRVGPAHKRALDQLRAVDHYLIWSHALVQRAGEAGARRVTYQTFACDPALHGAAVAAAAAPATGPDPLGSDVAFIGNWDPERERWLAAIAALDGVDLAIWGESGWKNRCQDASVRAAWRGRPLYGDEMARAMHASAINLNILRAQNKGACNMRTFEVPCAGGFLLHEASAEAQAIFPAGEACATFDSVSSLTDAVKHWLAAPSERARVAARGAEIAAGHTYARWAERVLAATGLSAPRPTG